ncbi:MAG: hypothetical protein E5V54_11350 [Mesorhizobium sp.]|nr:MAG: hypothetical protein E5V54_11350 [Mesorhizobium sp.]TIW80274.1 MAG: hypothetical protein E5V53_16330 [Mesorhizobium sp.]
MSAGTAFENIAKAIMNLQRALQSAGIKPDFTIELASGEQGEHFRYLADAFIRETGPLPPKSPQTRTLGTVNQVKVYGTAVEWPALRR